jgi:telomere length regulation protein
MLLNSSIRTTSFFFTNVFSVFFRQIIVQLLSLEEEREVIDTSDAMDKNGALLFMGETFSRICRRGSAGN